MYIDSPAFFSSSTGYKLCLRLYPNGDGNAQGTYISLYIILMRGEYDPILKFPFDYRVILGLIDQTDKEKHIINTLTPDPHSVSFQRPCSEMNVPSGIMEFAPLKLLEQENNPYIRDDTTFIKAMIDFEGMPEAIFPYALSLNNALSAEMQQMMIQAEIAKRHLAVISSASLANSGTREFMDTSAQQKDAVQKKFSNKKK